MKFTKTYAKAKHIKKSMSVESRERSYEERDERLIRELVKASGSSVRSILEQNDMCHA